MKHVMKTVIRSLSGILTGLFLVSATVSCVSLETIKEPPVPALAGQPVIEVEESNVLGLSGEMKAFVDDTLAAQATDDDRAWALAWSMLDPNILNFEYAPRDTAGERADAVPARYGRV